MLALAFVGTVIFFSADSRVRYSAALVNQSVAC